jgi:hypothetical protein
VNDDDKNTWILFLVVGVVLLFIALYVSNQDGPYDLCIQQGNTPEYCADVIEDEPQQYP